MTSFIKSTLVSLATLFATGFALGVPAPAWAQTVKLSTSLGDVTIALDKAKAPVSTENFLKYVKDGHYDGTIFHRVIGDFMIQAGGMNAEMVEKSTRAPIELESSNGLSNLRGSVAMARTQVPNSATAQFYINVKDNLMLDKANARDGQGYAVFGKVVSGMDVVDKIRAVDVAPRGMHQHVPVKPVVIKRATIVKQ
jgi:peptidyl-prolyl cis-trans isomerase A (cyclophilin A)